MSPILILIVVLTPLALTGIALLALRSRRRLPRKLDENWWPEFERAFRDYARKSHAESIAKRSTHPQT